MNLTDQQVERVKEFLCKSKETITDADREDFLKIVLSDKTDEEIEEIKQRLRQQSIIFTAIKTTRELLNEKKFNETFPMFAIKPK